MADKWSKTPSIPPNFVTILHLQERWLKQQEQKRIKEQQQEPEPEPEPEPKPAEQGGIRDVVDENVEAAGTREGENDVAGEAHALEMKEASMVSRNGGRLRKMSTVSGSGTEKEAPEGDASIILSQITAKKRKAWKSKSNQMKGWRKKGYKEKVEEEKAHAPEAKEEKAKSENADVADPAVDEIEEKLKDVSIYGGKEGGNDEPVGTDSGGHNRRGNRSGDKEERAKSGNEVVVDDQAVEIQGKLKDAPINGGKGWKNSRPARLNNGGYYRGGHRRFENAHHREEWKQRNAEMVWVKKGDATGGNAGEV